MGGIAEVLDAVAAELGTLWAPAPPDSIVRAEFDEAELSTLAGRRVWIYERGWGQVSKAARRATLNEYRVGIVAAERHAAEGPIPAAWFDERTAWVDAVIVGPLGDERRRLAANAFAAECYPQRAEVLEGIDPAGKRYERLFLVLVEIDYRRILRGGL